MPAAENPAGECRSASTGPAASRVTACAFCVAVVRVMGTSAWDLGRTWGRLQRHHIGDGPQPSVGWDIEMVSPHPGVGVDLLLSPHRSERVNVEAGELPAADEPPVGIWIRPHGAPLPRSNTDLNPAPKVLSPIVRTKRYEYCDAETCRPTYCRYTRPLELLVGTAAEPYGRRRAAATTRSPTTISPSAIRAD